MFTRKNILCCRPFPDSLLRQPNLMNSCERAAAAGTLIKLQSVRTRRAESPADPLTHPTGDHEIVDACQIFLQLQKLLEVLHLDQASLELLHHFRHISQSSYNGNQTKGIIGEGLLTQNCCCGYLLCSRSNRMNPVVS